jgi:predicted Zn-dependent protease
VAHSDAPGTAFTFTVIDSPDINAFALPGGYIYINRGLLAYLNNEGEMAGVLAHEIGHITASHHARQQTAAVTNKVVATTAYVLTGSGDLAEASNMYGTELISGYGRDMELEADGLAAQTMYKSGYDTDSLLAVIGVLKDQEQYQRVQATPGSKPVASYHGLYASHPRNDQRLKKVISTAGELDLDTPTEDPSVPGEFQRQIQGLVWGDSVQSQRAPERYYHNKLGFTFEHPPLWTVDAESKAIVASAPDGSEALTITIRRRDQAMPPRAVLQDSAAGTLSEGTELDQAGLKGYTAVAGSGASARRLAAIDYGSLSYVFEGKAQDFASADSDMLAMIESFRPMHPGERQTGSGHYIQYLQVPQGATLTSLAAGIRIPDAEAQLRLLNGLYPRGEPRTGDWIKVIR